MSSEQPKDPADVLFICSLEDLNCLHDYMVAAMAGDDLSELPRLWNQQIGVIRSRPHPAPAQQRIDVDTDALKDLQITAGLLYEFCEWFCDYDCEEKPCTVTVSRLHERLEGIKKQMEAHPEYLAKWNAKRAEQRALLQAGSTQQQAGERDEIT